MDTSEYASPCLREGAPPTCLRWAALDPEVVHDRSYAPLQYARAISRWYIARAGMASVSGSWLIISTAWRRPFSLEYDLVQYPGSPPSWPQPGPHAVGQRMRPSP